MNLLSGGPPTARGGEPQRYGAGFKTAGGRGQIETLSGEGAVMVALVFEKLAAIFAVGVLGHLRFISALRLDSSERRNSERLCAAL